MGNPKSQRGRQGRDGGEGGKETANPPSHHASCSFTPPFCIISFPFSVCVKWGKRYQKESISAKRAIASIIKVACDVLLLNIWAVNGGGKRMRYWMEIKGNI